ncbi:uncharacterized protein BXZ73DRAFT_46834 [Epithele typhae]|uniref:uncharacterized protein n=1 Tax=Epithele typhae TaxID=378194 RepID=UPI002007D43D|nr:uncharacterized protein BXZ73DRAFT_46834 [Epithele typhae]KAH9932716.1 hypothetical protein BXZ73DRAFT_46834 [Epithele typhae]
MLNFVYLQSKNADNKVFAVVRTPESAAQLHSLASTRSNVFTVKGDFDSVDSLKASMLAVTNAFVVGKLDVLIPNGALMISQHFGVTLDNPDPQSLEEELVAGVRPLSARRVVDHPTKQILAISSALADIDFVREIELGMDIAYAASKAALNMVATQFAVVLKPEGFTVLSISPGYVNTFTEDPSTCRFALFDGRRGADSVRQVAATFKRVAPDFDENPRTPADAVSMVLDVLNRSGPEQSGSFVSQYGNKEWI